MCGKKRVRQGRRVKVQIAKWLDQAVLVKSEFHAFVEFWRPRSTSIRFNKNFEFQTHSSCILYSSNKTVCLAKAVKKLFVGSFGS
jgi:hypothetical protein